MNASDVGRRLAAWSRRADLPRGGRFGAFLALSGALIAAGVLTAGTVVGRLFERHVLAHEQAYTAEVVRSQAHQHLRPDAFEPAVAPQAEALFAQFLEGLPGVFRVKVFDPSGRIVWSNEPRLIGRVFGDNAYLRRALAGEVATVLETPTRSEHTYERARRYVAEAYVPIAFPGGIGVRGVIETYKDATALMAGLRRLQWMVWSAAGGIGLFLYLTLAVVVWRASASELRAIARLERRNQDLLLLQQRLAAILAGIADSMLIVDTDMRVVWMNAAAAATMGAGGLGQTCYEAMGGDPTGCQSCPAVRTFASGTVERAVRAQTLPDGRVRHLDLITAPLRDASGRVTQVLEVARDVTELVEIEERLKHANEALLEAQARLIDKERLAAVGEVVVGLHHAILNPLTGILGALRLVREASTGAEDRARALADAEAEALKIERLVRRLDDLRRAESSPYVGKTTMLDLERLVREEPR